MAEEANLLAAFDSGDEHRLLKLWHELVTAAALSGAIVAPVDGAAPPDAAFELAAARGALARCEFYLELHCAAQSP